MSVTRPVTGHERFFEPHQLIVTKTDARGIVLYCNDICLQIAGYAEDEIVGKPHNILRHPDMPKVVFKLLWDTIQKGEEIFTYVVNCAKNGDHYWVRAQVTPTYDANNQITGYHSTRVVPDQRIVKEVIIPLYKKLREIETSESTAAKGVMAAEAFLTKALQDKGMDYNEWILSL
jgi:PAS domain S-box-containing protein